MEEIKFSAHHLIIESTNEYADILEATFNELEDHYIEGETHYQIEKASVGSGNYFWFYSSYGKAYPHTEHVYDIESESLEDNPRKPTQIEPSKQVFCLYDSRKRVLYLSNSQKKKLIEKYLSDKLQMGVIVKNFYIDPETFVKTINTIDSIKLVTKKNLFSEKSGLFSESKDIFGLGGIEEFCLEASFKKAKNTKAFKELFKSWAAKRGCGEIESLACIGYDDSDVETVFNADNLIRKVRFHAQKDENGLFKVDEIKRSLIGLIDKENSNV